MKIFSIISNQWHFYDSVLLGKHYGIQQLPLGHQQKQEEQLNYLWIKRDVKLNSTNTRQISLKSKVDFEITLETVIRKVQNKYGRLKMGRQRII